MNLSEFHYDLPASAIAQEPADPRDHSRLLVLDRRSETLQHKRFYDLVDLLKPGDLLVTNSTKVFPARLRGRKASGGKVEVLLLSPSPLVGEGVDGGNIATASSPHLSPPPQGGRKFLGELSCEEPRSRLSSFFPRGFKPG